MEKEIPIGTSKEDTKARRQIIKDFYAQWNAEHPDKKVWNKSLKTYIYIKNSSINEILGHASRSPEATEAQFHLTEILSNAELVKQLPLKAGNKNQKTFSKMYHLQWRQSRVLIGYQQSKGEHVLYYISGGQKK